MKYLMATYYPDRDFDETSVTPEEFEKIGEFMNQLNADLTASGEMLDGQGLSLPREARTVRLIDGVPVSTDGPLAEAKEVLAGFWVLDVASHDRAVEIASRIVSHLGEPIELRPIDDAPPEYTGEATS